MLRLVVPAAAEGRKWVSGPDTVKSHITTKAHLMPVVWAATWSHIQVCGEGALAPTLAGPQHCHACGGVDSGTTPGTALALLGSLQLMASGVDAGRERLILPRGMDTRNLTMPTECIVNKNGLLLCFGGSWGKGGGYGKTGR